MLEHELKNLLSGTGKTEYTNLIQTISSYLAAGKTTSKETTNTKRTKQEETELITAYINLHQQHDLRIDNNLFLAEGAEQKVYLYDDGSSVIKLNSGIFYYNWSDYLISLTIHNFFFPATQYTLLGFNETDGNLYGVVKQPYVIASEITNLEKVKVFMETNGFTLKKNNDYYNDSLGIIAEDLHDENVLTKDSVLFFIDTVFYITDNFYS